MSNRTKKAPMSQRLFNERKDGGPLPRHLQSLIYILCKQQGKSIPALNFRDQKAMGYWLKGNFTDAQIDDAHEKALEHYRSANKDQAIIHDARPTTQQDVPVEDFDFGAESLSSESNSGMETNEDGSKDKEKDDSNTRDQLDNDTDEEYVLRKDYDQDLKHTAKIFLNLEDKLKVETIQRQTNNDILSKGIIDLNRRIEEVETQKPLKLEVKFPNVDTHDVGIVHKQFPLLVKAANARLPDKSRLNIWLYGPAGTGKTHAAKKLSEVYFGNGQFRETNAKTLKEFRDQYNREWDEYNYSPTLSTGFEVMGYNDAHGRYVPTPFYLTYKYGGTFLLDEIDGSMQDALLKLNGALSSTYASFPCGMVERHKDAIIMAGANTTGHGGDIEYLGTMKQNVAFLDRWAFLHWPHDDALENALTLNKDWVKRVREVRRKLNDKKVKGHVITMRASMQGEALLAAGIPWDQVEEMVLRKGLPEGTWRLIK